MKNWDIIGQQRQYPHEESYDNRAAKHRADTKEYPAKEVHLIHLRPTTIEIGEQVLQHSPPCAFFLVFLCLMHELFYHTPSITQGVRAKWELARISEATKGYANPKDFSIAF